MMAAPTGAGAGSGGVMVVNKSAMVGPPPSLLMAQLQRIEDE
jgi:hypothetical protein